MSIMFDAVDIGQIPGDVPIVAGYVNGNYVTFNQLSARFPNARHLSIAGRRCRRPGTGLVPAAGGPRGGAASDLCIAEPHDG